MRFERQHRESILQSVMDGSPQHMLSLRVKNVSFSMFHFHGDLMFFINSGFSH